MSFLETFLLAVIWAPLVEELVFRSSIRTFLKNKVAFVIIASILFGLLHATTENGLFNIIITALPYIALGACFSCSYTKTNNIWLNIFMHAVNNLIAVAMLKLLLGV